MERLRPTLGFDTNTRLVGTWIVIVILGLGMLARHEFTPAPLARAAEVWPIQMPFALDSSRSSLLIFMHPNCPCSQASMVEFARLITRVGTNVSAHVIVYSWLNEPGDSRQSGAWKAASILPGVMLHEDENGSLARQFNVTTSGHVLLYDRAGGLLFSGGITGSRGHSGDNAGLAAIINLIESGSTEAQPIATTDVFGCAILSETR